jgi:DNA-binding NarL/FixJ family response regulator
MNRSLSNSSPAKAGASPIKFGASTSRKESPATTSHAIRVLCVDDHAMMVEGLRAQFSIDRSDGGIEIVGQLASADKLLDEVTRLNPNVVILDIEMPGPDAFETADRLSRLHPEVRVMILTAHIRDAYISAAFAAGAAAYFTKSDELEDIIKGIHEVVRNRRGMFVLGPKVRDRCKPLEPSHGSRSVRKGVPQFVGTIEGAPVTLLESLTARETEILRLIGKGLSRVQIAAQLCRSVKTVDGHQDRMMRKLGITARADLMRFAIREGLAQA